MGCAAHAQDCKDERRAKTLAGATISATCAYVQASRALQDALSIARWSSARFAAACGVSRARVDKWMDEESADVINVARLIQAARNGGHPVTQHFLHLVTSSVDNAKTTGPNRWTPAQHVVALTQRLGELAAVIRFDNGDTRIDLLRLIRQLRDMLDSFERDLMEDGV